MQVAHVGNYKPDSANGVDKTVAGLVRYLPTQGVHTEVWHFTPRVDRVKERTVEEITIFDSSGTAVEDVAAAIAVYERALASGRGIEVKLDD